jgi:hypothetical protein
MNNENGQKSAATKALFQFGLTGLSLHAFAQYQSNTTPDKINSAI